MQIFLIIAVVLFVFFTGFVAGDVSACSTLGKKIKSGEDICVDGVVYRGYNVRQAMLEAIERRMDELERREKQQ